MEGIHEGNFIRGTMVILSGLSKEIASQYTSELDPAVLWNTLDSVYNANTAITRSEIRKQFQQLKLEDYKSVSEYVETLKYTVSQMENMGIQVSTEEKIHQLYTGLPEAFSPTISYLQIANITDFNTIVSRIRDFGVIWEKTHKQSTEEAHYTNGTANRNRNNTNMKFPYKCHRCNQVGHRIRDCTKPKQWMGINESKEACVYCKKTNHKSEACFYKPNMNTQYVTNLVNEAVQAALSKLNIYQHQAHSTVEQAHQVKHSYQPGYQPTRSRTAMLDSAASRHLIKDASLIHNMHSLPRPVPMVVANNEVVNLNQGGTLTLNTSTTPIELDVLCTNLQGESH